MIVYKFDYTNMLLEYILFTLTLACTLFA